MSSKFPDHIENNTQAQIFSIKQAIEQGIFHSPIQAHIPYLPSEILRMKTSPEHVSITFGVPMDTPQYIAGSSHLIAPNAPHIFKISELTAYNRDPSKDVKLRDVIVMLGHAGRDKSDQWLFGDHQRVADVVEAFQKYARQNDLPLLEFIIACNKEDNSNAVEQGILVQDTSLEDEVVQCVGDIMAIVKRNELLIPKDGRLSIAVTPKKGEFWGLDKLVEKKRAAGLLV